MPKPNWRNIEDYDYLVNLSPEGLAWEFLRRNLDYRKDYQDLCEFLNKLEQDYGLLDTLSSKQLSDIPGAYIFEPEHDQGESLGEWNRRCISQGIQPKKYFVPVWRAKQWGIIGPMPDPFTEETLTPRFDTKPRHPRIVSLEECPDYFLGSEEGCDSVCDPDYPLVLVGFDLRLDLKKQSEEIRKRLSCIKKERINKKTSHQREKWTQYFRVLDAELADATVADMGEVLFGSMSDIKEREKRIYRYISRAKIYSNNKYCEIPLIIEKEKS